MLSDLGVSFDYNCDDKITVESLKEQGFSYVVVGIGAELDRAPELPGSVPVLDFLRRFHGDPSSISIGPKVAVIGAGDTAMDAARSAKRCSGVEEVTILYRRSAREMPATREEYDSAILDGIPFKFLRNPVRWESPGRLVCQVMELGPPDSSGRSRPVPTGGEEILAIDTVITAIGTEVDVGALRKIVVGNGGTGEDNGVFTIGDAADGASTIVKAIASARRVSDAILAREGGERFQVLETSVERETPLRDRRDRLMKKTAESSSDAELRVTESFRCLGCREMCLKCVEVCPNRANTCIEIPGFRDRSQIVHIDAFCNECGNCGTFCPWEGNPYLDKFTIFNLPEDFTSSTNPGFYLDGTTGVLRSGSEERAFEIDASTGVVVSEIGPDDRALIEGIFSEHAYLLGPVEL